MKKYIVLPFDEYIRLKKTNDCSEDKIIHSNKINVNDDEKSNEIKKSLDSILTNDKKQDSEKRILYSQILDKLISISNDERREKEIDKTLKHKSVYNVEDKIKSIFSNYYIKKGLILFNAIQTTGDITWNEIGEIFIRGNKITGSNILELINFSLRNINQAPPIGFDDYKKWFFSSGISHDLIENKLLKDDNSLQQHYSSPMIKLKTTPPSHSLLPRPVTSQKRHRSQSPFDNKKTSRRSRSAEIRKSERIKAIKLKANQPKIEKWQPY